MSNGKSIESAILTRIKQIQAVADIVVDRIRPGRLNQGEVTPAIAYSVILGDDAPALSGVSNTSRIIVQIDCYAERMATASVLAKLLRSELRTWRGITDEIFINECSLSSGPRHGYDNPSPGSDEYRYIVSQDFQIFFKEE